MTAGTANSPSVAEEAFALLFALIKRAREHDKLVHLSGQGAELRHRRSERRIVLVHTLCDEDEPHVRRATAISTMSTTRSA